VPSEWLRKRKKDQYHRLAKEKGFRSRSTFKLLQIAERYRFIRSGDRALDLGAAPGGWLQAIRQIAGPQGLVVGVDKEKITPLPFDNVVTVTRDVTQPNIVHEIRAVNQSAFDVVVSDLAPNVSGAWEVDHARQIHLTRCALGIARQVLRPRGNMLVKVFQGSELKEFQNEMKSCFRELKIVKPPASRPESAELYLLGLGFLG